MTNEELRKIFSTCNLFSENSKPEMLIKVLEEKGFKLTDRTEEGETCLHVLIKFFGGFKFYFNYSKPYFKAIIDRMDKKGSSPCHVIFEALSQCNLSVDDITALCDFISEYGLNIYILNESQEICFASFLQMGNHNNKALLIGAFLKSSQFDLSRVIEGKSIIERLNLNKINNEVAKTIMNHYLTSNFDEHSSEFCQMEDSLAYEVQAPKARGYLIPEILGHRFSLSNNILTSANNRFDNPDQEHAVNESETIINYLGVDDEVQYIHLDQGNDEDSLFSLAHSFDQFVKHCVNKKLFVDHLAMLRKIALKCRKASRYYTLIKNDRDEDALNDLLNECQSDAAMINTGFDAHAIVIVIAEGKFLYRCNKGPGSFGLDVIECYEITKPEALTIETLRKLFCDTAESGAKVFIQKTLHEVLGLQFIRAIEGKMQVAGNCTLEAPKMGIRAFMYHYLRTLWIDNDKTISPSAASPSSVSLYSGNSHTTIFEAKVQADRELSSNVTVTTTNKNQEKRAHKLGRSPKVEELFKAFTYFDRELALNHFIQQYRDTFIFPNMLVRLLCNHFDPTQTKDLNFGRIIAKHLIPHPRFKECFFELLVKNYALRKDKMKQQKFQNFLTALGIDLQQELNNFPIKVRLLKVIQQGGESSVTTVLNILAECKDFSMLTHQGYTPLHAAVVSGNRELVEVFAGAVPKWLNQPESESEKTPIFYVNHTKMAKYLVTLGARVDYKSLDGPPLYSILESRDLNLVKFFIKAGAFFVKGAKFDTSLLVSAAKLGWIELGEYVLEEFPEFFKKRSEKKDSAYSNDENVHDKEIDIDDEAVDYENDYDDENDRENYDDDENDYNDIIEKALFIAAECGHSDFIIFLRQKTGVSLASTDENGNTALHFAARNGKSEALSVLFKDAISNLTSALFVRNNQGKLLTAYHQYNTDSVLQKKLETTMQALQNQLETTMQEVQSDVQTTEDESTNEVEPTSEVETAIKVEPDTFAYLKRNLDMFV